MLFSTIDKTGWAQKTVPLLDFFSKPVKVDPSEAKEGNKKLIFTIVCITAILAFVVLLVAIVMIVMLPKRKEEGEEDKKGSRKQSLIAS